MKQKSNSKKQLFYIEEVGFEIAFTYIYSPREGTPAAKMVDNVPDGSEKRTFTTLK